MGSHQSFFFAHFVLRERIDVFGASHLCERAAKKERTVLQSMLLIPVSLRGIYILHLCTRLIRYKSKIVDRLVHVKQTTGEVRDRPH